MLRFTSCPLWPQTPQHTQCYNSPAASKPAPTISNTHQSNANQHHSLNSTSCNMLLLVLYVCHTTCEQGIITCQHGVSCRNVQTHRCTDCTLNAAVLLYTHCEEVFQRAMNTLHREEGTSITLIICTTNNCLVERDSYMLFQGASWSESLLG